MKWPHRLSIRWLLTGQFLVVVAVALAVVGVLTVYWRLPMAMEQQRAEQRRAGGIALLRVEANLELAERRLQTMQRTLRVMDGGSGWPLPRLLADDDFLAVYRVDQAGRVLRASLREAPARTDLPAVPPGLDLSNLPVLRRAAGRTGLTWSDQYLSPIAGVPVVALALSLGDGY